MDDIPTKTAVQKLKRGDIRGLKALVERYQVRALRTAYLITGDRALAEDIVQEAFLKVYQNANQFDAQRDFAPWFSRIVANGALQAMKRQQRFVIPAVDEPQEFADLPDDNETPEIALELAELRDTVRAALDTLPPDQRAVIVLRYYLDYSESETAQALNCPQGTVKWRLHAARKHLNAALKSYVSVVKGDES